MIADREGPLLNEHQQRHFEVLLSMLEASLTEVEQLASSPRGPAARLTVLEDDLREDFGDAIRPSLGAARKRIDQLASRLALRPRIISRARAIRALLTAETVRLADSTTEQLRGYGPVHPCFTDEVEPALNELRDLLSSVAALLDGSAPSRPLSTIEDRT